MFVGGGKNDINYVLTFMAIPVPKGIWVTCNVISVM